MPPPGRFFQAVRRQCREAVLSMDSQPHMLYFDNKVDFSMTCRGLLATGPSITCRPQYSTSQLSCAQQMLGV